MWQRARSFHNDYRQNGFYSFAGILIRKLLFILLCAGLLIAIFEWVTPGIEYYFQKFIATLHRGAVLIFFLLSEALLGLVPPDLFIIWGKQFSDAWLIIVLLGVLSYAGGTLSFFIGRRISRVPRIEKYIRKKYGLQFDQLKLWGGPLVLLAALFPIPYSPICLGAGVIGYKFRDLMAWGLFRVLRFPLYALLLFQLF